MKFISTTLFALTLATSSVSGLAKPSDVEIELLADFAFVYDENYHDLKHILSTIQDLDIKTQIYLLKEIRKTETSKKRRLELDRIIHQLNQKK